MIHDGFWCTKTLLRRWSKTFVNFGFFLIKLMYVLFLKKEVWYPAGKMTDLQIITHEAEICSTNSLRPGDPYASVNWVVYDSGIAWWRHRMETFSALLALCAGNSPVPVNSPHKGQWRRALMFSLICARINYWVINREAGDLRRHRGHYDANVMCCSVSSYYLNQCWLVIKGFKGFYFYAYTVYKRHKYGSTMQRTWAICQLIT